MGLNTNQELFKTEYLLDFNATQAAIRAGYSKKTAYSQGQRLLKNVEIQKAIDEHKLKISDKVEVKTEWVLSKLVELVDRCMQAEPVMEKIDGELQPTGEYKFDSSGANSALEKLGKYLKMFTDRQEIKTESKNENTNKNINNIDLNKLPTSVLEEIIAKEEEIESIINQYKGE